jgi:DNA-binding GntR family transcriptional regulator
MPLATPRTARHRTKQEFVYRTLRDSVMKCELKPGERLVIDELARRLSVSAIPVREALQILQSEGLVSTVPHVGATVAPISRESITEIFTVMEGLETVATRSASLRATPEDLDTLDAIVEDMDRALAARRYEQWAELNRRFHLTISRTAGMPMLQEMLERVLDHWERVRRFFFSGVLVHRVDEAQREHHGFAEAIRGRDITRLETMVRQHNQGALAAYTTYLDREPSRPAAR